METEKISRRLYRSRSDKMVAGVCGGLGKYFEIDPLIFRILFLLFVFGGGFGILLYIVLAIIIPKEPGDNAGNPGSQNPGEFKDKVNEFAEELKQSANSFANEAEASGRRSMRNVVGAFIAALGIFLLFGNLFPRFVRWDLFWPLALIFIGLLIIARKKS